MEEEGERDEARSTSKGWAVVVAVAARAAGLAACQRRLCLPSPEYSLDSSPAAGGVGGGCGTPCMEGGVRGAEGSCVRAKARSRGGKLWDVRQPGLMTTPQRVPTLTLSAVEGYRVYSQTRRLVSKGDSDRERVARRGAVDVERVLRGSRGPWRVTVVDAAPCRARGCG